MATEQGSQGMPCGGRALASMATVRGLWQFGGVVYCSLISRQSLSPTMPPSRREHDLTTHLKWPISTKDVMQSNPFNKQNFNLTAATWLIFSAVVWPDAIQRFALLLVLLRWPFDTRAACYWLRGFVVHLLPMRCQSAGRVAVLCWHPHGLHCLFLFSPSSLQKSSAFHHTP